MNGVTEAADRIKPGEFYRIREDGRWEIYLDATMAGTFGVCEEMFRSSFVERLTPKGDRPFARDLGSWWSDVMEHIYTADFNFKRLDSKEIVDMSMKVWNDLQMDELEKYHPRSFKEFGGRYGALQMIAEYATRLLPVDHKSIAYIDGNTSKKYKPHIQIPGYIVAGQILCKSLGYDLQVDRAVINCVARTDRTAKSGESKYPRFKRISVTYTPAELDEWKRRRLAQAERVRHCFEFNEWLWNENTCSNFYNKPCPFQNIHEKPPDVRQVVINADYVKRDFWIPGRSKNETEEKGE